MAEQACLSKCRSPLSFSMTEWREGTAGALIMGIRHGAFCTGCWALMLLMFVGGVMSLAWMAGLAVYFLAEKLLLVTLRGMQTEPTTRHDRCSQDTYWPAADRTSFPARIPDSRAPSR